MVFAREAGVAAILVSITLWVQCAGMAVLIRLARADIARSKNELSPWRAGVLIVRFSAAMVVLHILQILLWAGFYHWRCLPTWESCFYFSASSYSTVGYGDLAAVRDVSLRICPGEVVALFVGELHRPQAELILGQVQGLNQDLVKLPAAQRAIAEGLHGL